MRGAGTILIVAAAVLFLLLNQTIDGADVGKELRGIEKQIETG
jgi:hypothetical protein